MTARPSFFETAKEIVSPVAPVLPGQRLNKYGEVITFDMGALNDHLATEAVRKACDVSEMSDAELAMLHTQCLRPALRDDVDGEAVLARVIAEQSRRGLRAAFEAA